MDRAKTNKVPPACIYYIATPISSKVSMHLDYQTIDVNLGFLVKSFNFKSCHIAEYYLNLCIQSN